MFLTHPSVSQSVRQSYFICQHNSSETAQQNSMKLCSCEGHTMLMCISTGNFDSNFFSRSYALFELRNLAKVKDTTQNISSAQLH